MPRGPRRDEGGDADIALRNAEVAGVLARTTTLHGGGDHDGGEGDGGALVESTEHEGLGAAPGSARDGDAFGVDVG